MAGNTPKERFEFVRSYLQKKADKFKNPEDLDFFLTVFEILAEHESRLRKVEHETLPGNAFINPDEHMDIRHPLK